ncbi:hypothetical protein DFH11DRAFT_1547939 [Phellopilus nigrolimitatus]|nr:hypothetical protein DFH11DRAFT_1547939 [Phellopilus nigrolimitatus]
MHSIRSDAGPVDPSLVPLIISEIDIAHYIEVAILTLLVYDTIITMDKEIKYFWMVSEPLHWDSWSAFLYNVCKHSDSAFQSLLIILKGPGFTWINDLADILLIRVLAFYHQDKRLAACLRTLFGLEAAFMLGLSIYGNIYEEIVVLELAQGVTHCGGNRNPPKVWSSLSWAAPVLFAIILMVLALYKAAEHWRETAGFSQFTLVKVLIQDQAVYFIMAHHESTCGLTRTRWRVTRDEKSSTRTRLDPDPLRLGSTGPQKPAGAGQAGRRYYVAFIIIVKTKENITASTSSSASTVDSEDFTDFDSGDSYAGGEHFQLREFDAADGDFDMANSESLPMSLMMPSLSNGLSIDTRNPLASHSRQDRPTTVTMAIKIPTLLPSSLPSPIDQSQSHSEAARAQEQQQGMVTSSPDMCRSSENAGVCGDYGMGAHEQQAMQSFHFPADAMNPMGFTILSGQVPDFSSASGEMQHNTMFQIYEQQVPNTARPNRVRVLSHIAIPNTPSTGGPLSAPAPLSSQTSSFQRLYLPGQQHFSPNAGSVLQMPQRAVPLGLPESPKPNSDWSDDFGLPVWAMPTLYAPSPDNGAGHNQGQCANQSMGGEIDIDISTLPPFTLDIPGMGNQTGWAAAAAAWAWTGSTAWTRAQRTNRRRGDVLAIFLFPFPMSNSLDLAPSFADALVARQHRPLKFEKEATASARARSSRDPRPRSRSTSVRMTSCPSAAGSLDLLASVSVTRRAHVLPVEQPPVVLRLKRGTKHALGDCDAESAVSASTVGSDNDACRSPFKRARTETPRTRKREVKDKPPSPQKAKKAKTGPNIIVDDLSSLSSLLDMDYKLLSGDNAGLNHTIHLPYILYIHTIYK